MKYRLTVKGQVVLATLCILIGIQIGTMLNRVPDANIQPQYAAVPSVLQNVEVPEANATKDIPGNSTVSEEEGMEIKETIIKNASARIYFGADQWELQGKELEKLSRIIELSLKDNRLKIVVEGNINGYPDFNDSEFGKALSLKRAQVIGEYLVIKGVSKEQIIITSNGSMKPVGASQGKNKSWMDRRADVYIEGYPVNLK